jgi:formiminotetrahydrofolate cyclodeaminase
LKKATTIPLTVAERAREVRAILESLRPITNPKMASDITVGIALANAAVQGALANVEINLGDLKDGAFVADVQKRVAAAKT